MSFNNFVMTDNHIVAIARQQPENKGEVILYQPDDYISLDVWVEFETVWLTQAQMVVLFERERSVITEHINTIHNPISKTSSIPFSSSGK